MTITYGFYNSVGGDRTYNAVQFSSIFDGIITDGVFESIGLKLVVRPAASGMNVIVGDGKAWFNHTWTVNDADLTLAVSPSDLVNPRIDAVVLEIDASDAVRANTIKIITGTPAPVPVEPTLINTSEVHQYPLAWLEILANSTHPVQDDIIDLVGTYLCPYVTVPQAGGGTVGAAILETQIFS